VDQARRVLTGVAFAVGLLAAPPLASSASVACPVTIPAGRWQITGTEGEKSLSFVIQYRIQGQPLPDTAADGQGPVTQAYLAALATSLAVGIACFILVIVRRP
jgi:hypothetical protein